MGSSGASEGERLRKRARCAVSRVPRRAGVLAGTTADFSDALAGCRPGGTDAGKGVKQSVRSLYGDVRSARAYGDVAALPAITRAGLQAAGVLLIDTGPAGMTGGYDGYDGRTQPRPRHGRSEITLPKKTTNLKEITVFFSFQVCQMSFSLSFVVLLTEKWFKMIKISERNFSKFLTFWRKT